MSEKRKIHTSICLKNKASKESIRGDLYAAEQWEGGRVGLFRLRVGGKMVDGPDGEIQFIDMARAFEYMARLLAGEDTQEPPVPDLQCNTRVSVPTGEKLGSMALREITMTRSPCIRAYDGEYYIAAHLHGQGVKFFNVEDIVEKRGGQTIPGRPVWEGKNVNKA